MGTLPGSGVPTAGPPPEIPPPDRVRAPLEHELTPTTGAGRDIPITRCHYGNPLLPPYAPTGDDPATTTTSTTATTMEVPVTNGPGQPVTPTPDEPSPLPRSGGTPSVPEPSEPSVPDPDPYPGDQDQSTPNL